MIVLTHKHNSVVSVFDYHTKTVIQALDTKATEVLFQLATSYPNRLLAWCHDDLKEHINEAGFQTIFQHPLIMASYELRTNNFISERIGYVESTPFVNINKKVTYPTWLMSSCVGAIHAQVLLKFNPKDYKHTAFAYALNSIAKKGMVNGLFCYSTPELLKPTKLVLVPYSSPTNTLYQFIKQHYRSRWTFITFFNSFLYEKKLHILPLIRSLFVPKKTIDLDFRAIEIAPSKEAPSIQTIDVIIPTMGRKPYLYDVLKDLSQQTLLPKQVIIVEQNPDTESASDLDYLTSQSWPFHIDHVFTHQTGACNARNLALKKASSDYVFMADDDIRFQPELLENALKTLFQFGLEAATLSCLQKGETEKRRQEMQWHTFGTASSIVATSAMLEVSFDMAFEYGFGEDGDFGMQLRNLGIDIGYLPHSSLLHLKAPMGGFRTPFAHPWEKDNIQPKPSPTVMLFHLKHQSRFQVLSYKSILFFKFYGLQSIKNPIAYVSMMKKRWNKSVFWAEQLRKQSRA